MVKSKRLGVLGAPPRALLSALCLLVAPYAAAQTPPPDPVELHRNAASDAMERMRVGDALLRLGDLAGACKAYRETIALLPSWWMPRLAIVRCGRFVGLPIAELLEHARYAVKARPQLSVCHRELGMVLEEAGQQEEAILAYEAALRADPDLTDVRYRLGVLLARLSQHAAAQRHLEKVVEARPDHVVALRHLAETYEQLGQLAQAEACLLDLTVRSRFRALALSRLARFYERHGMAEPARRARERYRDQYLLSPQ